jgi:TonB family protein
LEVTQLGRNLANQLADALPRSKKFALVDRSKMLEELRENDPSLLTSSDIDPGRVLQLTHVDAEILGHLEKGSDSLSLKLEIRRIKKMQTVARLAESLPTSAETETQFSNVLSASKYADAEAVGYTPPACIHCPMPEYTDAAFSSRTQGSVMLNVIIEPDDRAHEIAVAKHLRADLEASAIKAVGQWAFKPATGTDGKPAAVKMLIEIDFYLYR